MPSRSILSSSSDDDDDDEDLDGNEALFSEEENSEDYTSSLGFTESMEVDSSDSEHEEKQEGSKNGVSRLKGRAAKVSPAGALRLVERGDAAVGDDGAGPSRPSHPTKNLQLSESALETKKQLKIAGIRASLQYNGYPSDVIEDLIQNNLKMHQQQKGNYFAFRLKLPNGNITASHEAIDANPYPGGKIIEKSARKCHKSDDCLLPLGHEGKCALKTAVELDPNDPLNLKIEHATTGVRTALIYAGYPIEVVDTTMENDFRIKAFPNSKSTKYGWSVKLINGKRVSNLTEILKFPYPGGKVVENPICPTVGCGKKIGHTGYCRGHGYYRSKVKREAETDSTSPSPAVKKPRAVSPSQLSRSILSSSSDEEQESDKGEEQEQPREEESPIYLLTTEDEEDSDFQGEDEYSSLYD